MKTIHWGVIGVEEPGLNEVMNSEVVATVSEADALEVIQDERVNAVFLNNKAKKHVTFAIMAMKLGKPVMVKAPLAASYEDCIRIMNVSKDTGVPCFVQYHRRELEYFKKVKELVDGGAIGKVMNVQLRFSESGRGCFYEVAARQIDLLQQLFGIMVRAHGYTSNRQGEDDNVSACFLFDSGLTASGTWCFTGHDSAKEDRIEVIGDKGILLFSVFRYEPIHLINEQGSEHITIENPANVHLPIIKAVVEHLQGFGHCDCDCISAASVNWVMDKVLWRL